MPGLRQSVGRYYLDKYVQHSRPERRPVESAECSPFWSSFLQQDRIVMRETPGFSAGQFGLYATVNLRPGECHLRFINITVDAADLENNIDIGPMSNLSVMDEAREFERLALGPSMMRDAFSRSAIHSLRRSKGFPERPNEPVTTSTRTSSSSPPRNKPSSRALKHGLATCDAEEISIEKAVPVDLTDTTPTFSASVLQKQSTLTESDRATHPVGAIDRERLTQNRDGDDIHSGVSSDRLPCNDQDATLINRPIPCTQYRRYPGS